MPVTISKKDHSYSVSTPSGTKAKSTSLRKALAQRNLLNAVEHSSWRPTGKPSQMAMKKHVMKMRAKKK
ncbi:MAG TPA: hypothetical protein VFF49_01345 [Thermodesulfobacteriota bacterium]|nr:hypothetical protein [Thermodesulfobacteriota bacterium]